MPQARRLMHPTTLPPRPPSPGAILTIAACAGGYKDASPNRYSPAMYLFSLCSVSLVCVFASAVSKPGSPTPVSESCRSKEAPKGGQIRRSQTMYLYTPRTNLPAVVGEPEGGETGRKHRRHVPKYFFGERGSRPHDEGSWEQAVERQ